MVVIDFIVTLGDDQSHHPLQSQNQQQRPPSEHIYFSIESDYNSTLAPTPNVGNEPHGNPQATQNTISVHRPSVAAQQWRLTGTHKNSAQPYMV